MIRVERTAIIEPGAEIGDNCYIGHYTIIRPGVEIGDGSEIRAHCFVAAGAKIGKNSNIYQFANICRDTIIGDNVFIAPGVIMTNTRKIAFNRDYEDICEAPVIENCARLGGRVTLLPGVTIGFNSLVGAGSVVTRDVGAYEIHIGVPAKYVGVVDESERI